MTNDMVARRWMSALVAPLLLYASPLAARGPLAEQDPASAQPTLPKSMPDLTVPVSSIDLGGARPPAKPRPAERRGIKHRRYVRYRDYPEPPDRPALASVELLETLPHPPQPPHVTVPVPAYPLEDFVTSFTTPPPPVVCREIRYDRFKPEPRLVDAKPVMCTADNP